MPAPSIKSRMVPDAWVIAVVHMSAPAVAAVKPNMVATSGIESPRVVGMPAARDVRALHVTAMPSSVHDPRPVVFTHNPAPTVDSMFNMHAATIDRTHRPVGANSRRSSTLQTDALGSCRMTRAAMARRRSRVRTTCRAMRPTRRRTCRTCRSVRPPRRCVCTACGRVCATRRGVRPPRRGMRAARRCVCTARCGVRPARGRVCAARGRVCATRRSVRPTRRSVRPPGRRVRPACCRMRGR